MQALHRYLGSYQKANWVPESTANDQRQRVTAAAELGVDFGATGTAGVNLEQLFTTPSVAWG